MKAYTGFETNGYDEDASANKTSFQDAYGNETRGEVEAFEHSLENYGSNVFGNAIGNIFHIHAIHKHPVMKPISRAVFNKPFSEPYDELGQSP